MLPPLAGATGKILQLGAPMHALRSRTGVVSITVGAAVLLALPVVAAGQVPGVDQVVRGVKEGKLYELFYSPEDLSLKKTIAKN